MGLAALKNLLILSGERFAQLQNGSMCFSISNGIVLMKQVLLASPALIPIMIFGQ